MSAWAQEVVQTITTEFSDLRDVAEITRVVLRLLMAGTLGAILGYERERKGKAAGVRTYMLVSLGSAVCVMTPQLAGVGNEDITRVMQGVISGIGFLGAGAIIKRDRDGISGLTTAAGIWMTAAIGMAAGMGREATAVLSTLIALVTFALGSATFGWLSGRHPGKSVGTRDAPR